jgi:hypothetical protein
MAARAGGSRLEYASGIAPEPREASSPARADEREGRRLSMTTKQTTDAELAASTVGELKPHDATIHIATVLARAGATLR